MIIYLKVLTYPLEIHIISIATGGNMKSKGQVKGIFPHVLKALLFIPQSKGFPISKDWILDTKIPQKGRLYRAVEKLVS